MGTERESSFMLHFGPNYAEDNLTSLPTRNSTKSLLFGSSISLGFCQFLRGKSEELLKEPGEES